MSAEITVDCGKYHLVKRMVAAAGNSVDALHRQSIGALSLPNDLTVGDAVLIQKNDADNAFVQML